MDYRDVLTFWLEECTPRQWFAKDEQLDETIRRRFTEAYWQATRGETARWRETAEGRVAEIIVLDQFARNIFRDSPQAFAQDAMALQLSAEAIELELDKGLSADMRHFLYMPYMHSESRTAHRRAVRLFASLLPWKLFAFLFELRHKRIIDRFGRFPHRNAVLGRASTPDEQRFMRVTPASDELRMRSSAAVSLPQAAGC